MVKVVSRDLPGQALIVPYRDADCFVTTLPGRVGQADFIEAFYTSWLFKLERLVLAALVGKPSTDAQARRLARDELQAFAAWTVEARSPDQIVMCDYQGMTRSWLMTCPEGTGTALHFGTVVAPPSGDRRSARIFDVLTPVHRLYARALLAAAAGRLLRKAAAP